MVVWIEDNCRGGNPYHSHFNLPFVLLHVRSGLCSGPALLVRVHAQAAEEDAGGEDSRQGGEAAVGVANDVREPSQLSIALQPIIFLHKHTEIKEFNIKIVALHYPSNALNDVAHMLTVSTAVRTPEFNTSTNISPITHHT